MEEFMEIVTTGESSFMTSHHHHMMYHYPPTPLSNLTLTNCTDGVPWIRDYIGSCVLDTRHYAAVIAGLMSTFFSTINGLPQIYVNCAKGIPDKALSIFLILQWLAGDALNLIGGLLTHQTPVQIIYACFMVSVDVIMLIQYTFFKIKHSIEDAQAAKLRAGASIQDGGSSNLDSASVTSPSSTMTSNGSRRTYNGSVLFCAAMMVTWGGGGLWMKSLTSEMTSAVTLGDVRTFTGRRLLTVVQPLTFFHGTKDKIGFALGVVSTACYMGSRIPQIYKNWQRQSTVGVSFGLFFLMIASNACYGSSILLHSTDLYPVLHSMPWILGALGMIAFDLVIMFQFWYYRRSVNNLLITETTDYESSQRLIDDV